jgi:hypothetical protein
MSYGPTPTPPLADPPADDAEAEVAQALLDAALLAGMRRPVNQPDERPLDRPRLAVALFEFGNVGRSRRWVWARRGGRRWRRLVRVRWRERGEMGGRVG